MHNFLTKGGVTSPIHDALLSATAADLTGQDRPADRIREPVARVSDGPAGVVADNSPIASLPPAKRPEDFGLIHVPMIEFDDLVRFGWRPPEPIFQSFTGVWVSPDWATEARQVVATIARAAAAKSQDGQVGGPATSVHAGASEGAGRSISEVLGPYLDGATVTFRHPKGDTATVGIVPVLDAAQRIVERIYDDLQTILAQAGPLPLLSSEPWVEPVDKFASRLQRHYWAVDLSQIDEDTLEDLGNMASLPRARLVQTQGGE